MSTAKREKTVKVPVSKAAVDKVLKEAMNTIASAAGADCEAPLATIKPVEKTLARTVLDLGNNVKNYSHHMSERLNTMQDRYYALYEKVGKLEARVAEHEKQITGVVHV
jgi:hypothetical protein